HRRCAAGGGAPPADPARTSAQREGPASAAARGRGSGGRGYAPAPRCGQWNIRATGTPAGGTLCRNVERCRFRIDGGRLKSGGTENMYETYQPPTPALSLAKVEPSERDEVRTLVSRLRPSNPVRKIVFAMLQGGEEGPATLQLLRD